MENDKPDINIDEYSQKLGVQLRKGFLAYCVLVVCSGEAVYSSEIIRRLKEAEIIVVEGTLYPLLNRLQTDGLLTHDWQESDQGPPRKYYKITKAGRQVKDRLAADVEDLHTSINQLTSEK